MEREWGDGSCESRALSRVEAVDPSAREKTSVEISRVEVVDPSSTIGKLVEGDAVYFAIGVGVVEDRRGGKGQGLKPFIFNGELNRLQDLLTVVRRECIEDKWQLA